MTDIKQLLNALELAAERHREQFRKGAEPTPYINHPIQVAKLLTNPGDETNINLLTAAILHDTIEDTVKSEEDRCALEKQIADLFGQEVLHLVLECTDDKSLEKQTRKRLQIEHAPHKSNLAKKLKLADKITNIRDIILNPPSEWDLQRKQEYLLWAEKVVEGLRGANARLETLFDEWLEKGKQQFGMN